MKRMPLKKCLWKLRSAPPHQPSNAFTVTRVNLYLFISFSPPAVLASPFTLCKMQFW